jgi:hypothetical protein
MAAATAAGSNGQSSSRPPIANTVAGFERRAICHVDHFERDRAHLWHTDQEVERALAKRAVRSAEQQSLQRVILSTCA